MRGRGRRRGHNERQSQESPICGACTFAATSSDRATARSARASALAAASSASSFPTSRPSSSARRCACCHDRCCYLMQRGRVGNLRRASTALLFTVVRYFLLQLPPFCFGRFNGMRLMVSGLETEREERGERMGQQNDGQC